MMTPAEITAFVMALPVEELRRRTAEDVMGWKLRDDVDIYYSGNKPVWTPSEEGNEKQA